MALVVDCVLATEYGRQANRPVGSKTGEDIGLSVYDECDRALPALQISVHYHAS